MAEMVGVGGSRGKVQGEDANLFGGIRKSDELSKAKSTIFFPFFQFENPIDEIEL
jgi:hypothetical protein